jgi:uncharacterized membrane protein
VGTLVGHAEQNWFIGIRTPWTMSSKKVWEKTHKLGGALFKIAGVVTILLVFIPKYAFVIFLAVILAAAFVPMIYSYVIFKK